MSCIRELEGLGCTNYGDDCNHSKCVMSESEGILFTANIDGNHGMKNGFEVGCVLEEEDLNDMRILLNLYLHRILWVRYWKRTLKNGLS